MKQLILDLLTKHGSMSIDKLKEHLSTKVSQEVRDLLLSGDIYLNGNWILQIPIKCRVHDKHGCMCG